MKSHFSRRNLLRSATFAAALPALEQSTKAARTPRGEFGSSPKREESAYNLRMRMALQQARIPYQIPVANSDEGSMPNWVATFTKGLPHQASGEVETAAIQSLFAALESGDPADFAAILTSGQRRLVSPQAAFSYTLEGGDPQRFSVPPAPKFSSPETAWEMTELYWQALTRDIPFTGYGDSSFIQRASGELGVTPATVFRGPTAADQAGPYISQFLWKPIPYLSQKIPQLHRVPVAATSFMTTFEEWLAIQNGVQPARSAQYDSTLRYIRNGRDLAEYVHYDILYQPYLNAAAIIMNRGPETETADGREGLSATNPYRASTVEDGFVNFGAAHVADWLARVSTAALKAAWVQKWLVHRRLRPEAFGGAVHQSKAGALNYPIHESLLNAEAVAETFAQTGTYFLPQAYPEGSPVHPAYPAGHATVAGACSAILKAFFNENALLDGCVEASADGLSLIPCDPSFRPAIGAEVNKLAFNIAMGRDWAGIHYRSDASWGMRLGEEVAISILHDLRGTFTEEFDGFHFTRLDGTPVVIA